MSITTRVQCLGIHWCHQRRHRKLIVRVKVVVVGVLTVVIWLNLIFSILIILPLTLISLHAIIRILTTAMSLKILCIVRGRIRVISILFVSPFFVDHLIIGVMVHRLVFAHYFFELFLIFFPVLVVLEPFFMLFFTLDLVFP